MNSGEALNKLHRMMDQLGFQSESKESPGASAPRQVHALRYADPQGNCVELRFSLRVSPGCSGLVIEALFNNDQGRMWDSVEAVIDNMPAAVAEWLQAGVKAAPVEPVPASRPRTRSNTARVLDDIRAGLDDQDLMDKYGFSHRRLLSLMSKLVWEGLLTQEELAKRKSMARTVLMPIYQCRLCQEMSFEKNRECPRCGGPMIAANKKRPD
jgi:hypothetical protein